MNQEQCMEAIQPLLSPWYDGWHLAFARYRSYPAEFAADHDDSAAASCIRCHMWAWLLNNMADHDGVHLLRAGATQQLKLLNYRDVAVARFKKVDGGGRHAALLTNQQDDFDRQKPLIGVPPEAFRLTSGYEPSPSGDEVRRIIVSRVHGRTVLWASQINVVAEVATWEDITPARLPGTNRIQDRPRRAG